MNNPAIVSALIAGGVSLITSIIGFVILWITSHQRMILKIREIKNIEKTIIGELERLRQTQFIEILKKRIEIYPKLWSILIRYETNYVINEKLKNRLWACKYLEELNEFNIEGGLFFSEELYIMFDSLRATLIAAINETRDGELIREELVNKIRKEVYGISRKHLGLSYHLKNSFGSYVPVAIQLQEKKKSNKRI